MEEKGREGSVTSAMLPLMLTLVFMHMLILVLMKLMMLLTDDEAGDDDDVDDSAIGMEGRGSSCNPSHPSPARWLMLELLPAPRKPRITTHRLTTTHPPSKYQTRPPTNIHSHSTLIKQTFTFTSLKLLSSCIKLVLNLFAKKGIN